ncbi:MAG: hypothetical protein U1E76_07195 [Planctomycetota bacterium]
MVAQVQTRHAPAEIEARLAHCTSTKQESAAAPGCPPWVHPHRRRRLAFLRPSLRSTRTLTCVSLSDAIVNAFTTSVIVLPLTTTW